MKALVQRVVSGSVAVDGETVSRIGRGIVALIGIHRYP
jgi:D-Tyr-tRNAtyr deacylase